MVTGSARNIFSVGNSCIFVDSYLLSVANFIGGSIGETVMIYILLFRFTTVRKECDNNWYTHKLDV